MSVMQAMQTRSPSSATHNGNAAMIDNALKMGTRKLKILVADDHDIIRRGLKQLLLARPASEICGEAKTGREAVTLCEELKPEVVVMDISMPELTSCQHHESWNCIP